MPYDDQLQWIRDWYQSQTNRDEAQQAQLNRRSYPLVVAEDGTFRVEDVIEGAYSLSVAYYKNSNDRYGPVPEGLLASGKLDFDIPYMQNGRSDEAFDLGSIPIDDHRPLEVGQVAPSFRTTDIHGKSVDFRSFQGQYILLHFWQLIRPNTVEDLATLKGIADVFKNDERLVIVGVTFGLPEEIVQAFAAHHQIPWIQIVLRDLIDFGFYRGGNGEANYLIGPDGTLLTEPLKLPEMLDVVTRELSR